VAAGGVAEAAADGAELDGPTLCPFRLATGLPCPFCGLTRSLFALGQARPGEAVELHPLGLAVPLAAVAFLILLARGRRPRPSGGLVAAGIALIAAAWVIQLAKGTI